MLRTALPGVLGLLALVTPLAASADPVEDKATAVVQSFDEDLMSVMKAATALGYEGRYKRLEPVVDRTFDIPTMTKIVAGGSWAGWSDAQREEVIAGFRHFIIATYARRFDDYGGESFKVTGSQTALSGVLVNTELDRPDDAPVTLNYLTRPDSAGNQKVVDVFLTGTISELATRRSEFSAVIAREGYQGLLKALDRAAMPDQAKN